MISRSRLIAATPYRVVHFVIVLDSRFSCDWAVEKKILLRNVCPRWNEICGYSNDIGWRRPIGCLKLQVILRTRATNSRALLRKSTYKDYICVTSYKDKASYGSSPPCTQLVHTARTSQLASSPRLLKTIGLFCRILSLL